MHSSYVKTPRINAVLDSPGLTCDQKLENIKRLAEGKKVTLVEPEPGASIENLDKKESGGSEPMNTGGNVSGNPIYVDKILDQISGVKEKELALVILQEIEKSNYISYDRESYELIINGETIKFTNILHLINFVISASPNLIPLGHTIFINLILLLKIPWDVIRNGDSQETRQNLLKIEELKKKTPGGGEAPGNENGYENMEQAAAEPSAVAEPSEIAPVEKKIRKKRGREDDTEDLGQPAKRNFGVEESALKGLRRSPRLRENIAAVWSGSSKKKRGKNEK